MAVVVPTRDRPALLEGAAAALAPVAAAGADVVVVDSASRDPAVRRIAEAAGLRVVRCARPGASRARNAGVRATTAPLLAFTDDDCRPAPGWLEALAGPLADPAVGFVTGTVLADRHDGPVVSTLPAGRPARFGPGTDPARVGHGANLAVRRVALAAIGGFDEALGAGSRFAGSEDQDLVWRLLRAGWLGAFEPAATVTHVQWRSWRQVLRTQYGYGAGSGALAVKARRLDNRSGRILLRARLWDDGLRAAWSAAGQGHRGAAAGAGARLAGTVVGAARAAVTRLDGDRYRA